MVVTYLQDEILIEDFKRSALTAIGNPAGMHAEEMTIKELFELADLADVDLSRVSKVAASYRLISPYTWISEGGQPCFTVTDKNGPFSHLRHYATEAVRDAKSGDFRLLDAFMHAEPTELLRFKGQSQMLAVISQRLFVHHFVNHTRMALRGATGFPYAQRVLDNAKTSDAFILDYFATKYHRQWAQCVPLLIDKQHTLGAEHYMLVIDLYRATDVDHVYDLISSSPLFRGHRTHPYLLSNVQTLLAGGDMTAEEAVDLLGNCTQRGLVNASLTDSLASHLIRGGGVCAGGEGLSSELDRFWINLLPTALMASKGAEFSPLTVLLYQRFGFEVRALKLIPEAAWTIEALTQAMSTLAVFIRNEKIPLIAATEALTNRNEYFRAVSVCRELLADDEVSRVSALNGIARSFTERLLQKGLRSNTFPFDCTKECANAVDALGKEFATLTGHHLLELFRKLESAKQIRHLPGALLFIKVMADEEGWTDEQRFDLVTRYRSWEVRQPMLELFNLPKQFYARLPPSQRRGILATELSL